MSSGSSCCEVVLHVYDVTKTGNDKTDKAIRNINRFFKDGIGVGGIFHSAVQFRQAKSDIVDASRAAYSRIMTSLGQNNSQDKAETQTVNQKPSSHRFQGNWFKNMVSAGAKPSTPTTNSSREADDESPLHGQNDKELSEL